MPSAAYIERLWTPAEDRILRNYYGLESADAIRRRIARESGKKRTRVGVYQRAKKMGLDYRQDQGYYSVPEIMKLLGITRHTLMGAVRAGKVRPRRSGKTVLFPASQMEILQEIYQSPPHGWVRLPEIAPRLGYSVVHMYRLVRTGDLVGTRIAGKWWINPVDAQRLAAEILASAYSRRSLKHISALDAQRARNRRDYRLRKERALLL